MSIHQGRVGLRGRSRSSRFDESPQCPSIRAASASAALDESGLPLQILCVHPSGPRRPPRHHVFRPDRNRLQVSIHQGRVGLRGEDSHGEHATIQEVSIHQGRVGLRGLFDTGTGRGGPMCPSIRAASASAAGSKPRPAKRNGSCPSIRAASASAASPRRPPTRPTACVHPSGPRRPPRRSQSTPRISCEKGVHPSGPRRPPRLLRSGLFGRVDIVSIHQGRVGLRGGRCAGGPGRPGLVSIHQGRVGLRGP